MGLWEHLGIARRERRIEYLIRKSSLTTGEWEELRALTVEQRLPLSAALADIITSGFAYHLEHAIPLIRDARLLPYPKEVIEGAFCAQEQELASFIGSWVADRTGEGKSAAEVEAELCSLKDHLETLRSVHAQLWYYADFGPEDRAAVVRFNGYGTRAAIPKNEMGAYLTLYGKCTAAFMQRFSAQAARTPERTPAAEAEEKVPGAEHRYRPP